MKFVLGAAQFTTETDFDNIPPVVGGYFIVNTSTKQHAPFEDSNARGLLEVFINNSGYFVQRYTESNVAAYINSVWLRSRNSGTWSSWQRIDNYGTSSLADLASVLGGVKSALFVTDDDIDTYYGANKQGFYTWNGPQPSDRGLLIVFYHSSGRTLQVKFIGFTQEIYMRWYDQNAWYPWKKMSLPSYLQPYSSLADLASALKAIW